MRLIDADALIEFCAELWIPLNIDAVNMQPTIRPEPQEGYWIRTDCGLDVECKCSVCGYKDFVPPHDIYWFKRNYCPNCGADMRGGQDG